ncbi:MAG: hypothetical protein OXG76_11290 [Acidimicrobiaceae bacterium]|nr:hypothetical protein [Acidimicrobiaceae bacterium]
MPSTVLIVRRRLLEVTVSEEDRSRLYAWLREQTDEPLAEYLMSCLRPASLSDMATKDFLTAEMSRFATKEDLAALDTKVGDLDTKVAQLDTKVAALDAKVDLLASQHKADRDEDRRTSRVRHYWLAGIGLSAALPIWLGATGAIG